MGKVEDYGKSRREEGLRTTMGQHRENGTARWTVLDRSSPDEKCKEVFLGLRMELLRQMSSGVWLRGDGVNQEVNICLAPGNKAYLNPSGVCVFYCLIVG